MAGWGEKSNKNWGGGVTPSPTSKHGDRAGPNSEESVAAAVWLGDARAVRRMLWPDTGGKPSDARDLKDKAYILANSRGKQNETPLHVAVRGSVEIATVLLEAGAEPNMKDKSGWTPLHFAAMRGNSVMCELLLKWGANKQVFTEDADQRRPKSPWDLAPPADARLRALLSYPGVERNVLGGPRTDAVRSEEGSGGSAAGTITAVLVLAGALLTLVTKVFGSGKRKEEEDSRRKKQKGAAAVATPPLPKKW